MSAEWKELLFPKCFDFQYTFKSIFTSSFSEELNFISGWKSEVRKIDFLTSRSCAHDIFLKYYDKSKPILKNGKGVPEWGFPCIGSLSHTQGCWGAVIGINSPYSSVGIDIENIHRFVPISIVKRICTEQEIDWLHSYHKKEQNSYMIMLFSLKEALYKALSLEKQKEFSFQKWKCILIENQGSNVQNFEIIHIDRKHKVNARILKKDSFIFSGVWI